MPKYNVKVCFEHEKEYKMEQAEVEATNDRAAESILKTKVKDTFKKSRWSYTSVEKL